MNITGRPITPKTGKPKRNKAHMAKVAQLDCVICGARPVAVHHCIHARYSQARAPDEMTIPLCPACHDELHADKTAWADKHGPDFSYLPVVNRLISKDEDDILGDWF